ncbi:MAG TPA: hypothetical protein VHG27_06250 [Xanthobacteraceae bacterium]|nr:hypothetical protein [Xanthobacteraceae bacterium]
MDAVFAGVVQKDGRVRITEAFKGVRVGQIIRLDWARWDPQVGERVVLSARRVRPGVFALQRRTGAGAPTCHSSNLKRETQKLRRIARKRR